MAAQQVGLDGEPTDATAGRCPVCAESYAEQRRGSKITIPDGYTACLRDREYEGDASTGIWYLHELEDVSRWFYCPTCDIEFRDGNAVWNADTLIAECAQCDRQVRKEVGRA